MTKDRHKNRGGLNRIDLVGKVYGLLTVVGDTGRRKSRRPIYSCICECGNAVEVLGKYLTNGDTKSCGCWAKNNPSHNRDAVGDITLSFWTPIAKQAKRRGIPFEVTREFAWGLFQKQEGRCALTGVPLKFSTNVRDQRGTQTASLDRSNNSIGYTEENVQWVHKKVNIMKNVMSNHELLEWCGLIQKWARCAPKEA